MNKYPIYLTITICLLLSACSKKNDTSGGQHSPPPYPIKIEVVSGSGQTDTIGLQLANSIVVKVTQNGQPVSGYSVQFQGSGCNSDLGRTTITSGDGTASTLWRLAGDVGQQTMKVYALNSTGEKVDSASATATGIAAGNGWQFSACSIVGGNTINTFCKLSSGRIFACYPAKNYVRYSDDNGASWLGVASLGNSHYINWLLSTPADELYVFALDGVYYSKDAGMTWTTLPATPFTDQVNDGVGTADGKLIIACKNDVSVSVDKGQTWTKTPYSSFIAPNSTGGDEEFATPAEDKNGNLYVDGRETGTIYQSTDNGKTWSPQAKDANELDFGFYIDNNGWYYKNRWDSTAGGLYVSKDQGATYTKLVSAPNTFLTEFSVQSDGNYYYENSVNQDLDLFQSNGITSSVKPVVALVGAGMSSAPYIVTKNGNIITGYNSNTSIIYFKK